MGDADATWPETYSSNHGKKVDWIVGMLAPLSLDDAYVRVVT